jgi:adenylate cyclase
MAQTVSLNVVGAVSHANLASNAFFTPEISRFIREVLEKALANPVGVAPRWAAEAWAMLANTLVNDYLHGWNHVGKEELNRAEDAAENALALNRRLPLGHHARGLVNRARGQHREALAAFEEAVRLDPYFARAHAQKGNELALLGRPRDALPSVDEAIRISPNDPALGIFYWVKGRAHFFVEEYPEAIDALRKSVLIQPTVWYNWAYLVSAYALSPNPQHKKEANNILQKFTSLPQFRGITVSDVREYEKANPDSHAVVVNAREKLHQGLSDVGLPP